VLYALPAVRWRPAAPLTVVIAITARHRIRAATDAYARHLEAAARLHATTLAQRLGIIPAAACDAAGEHLPGRPLDREIGRALTRHLRTRPPPPAPGRPFDVAAGGTR